MPQKRNPDLMELVRGRTHTVLALQQQIGGIIAGLPSGYNIDFQETKGPMIRAFDMVNDALAICALTIRNTNVNQEGIRAACTPELFATDAAYRLVGQGMPFRDAYHRIAKIAHDLPPVDPDTALRERTAPRRERQPRPRSLAAVDRRGARYRPTRNMTHLRVRSMRSWREQRREF